MMTRRTAVAACAAALTTVGKTAWGAAPGDPVRLVRVPNQGLQPQTFGEPGGVLHMLYFEGDPRQGDLYYSRSEDAGMTFASPLRVNSQEGSAIAIGTIRGGQLAVGKGGRVYAAWNGSDRAQPEGVLNPDSGKPGAPMLYARLNERRTAFEPQRNLMLHSFGLDGGGSIAADRDGHVYVAWHGIGDSGPTGAGQEGEARRSVWITKSTDHGRTFLKEAKAWPEETGACGCCGMKLFAGPQGDVLGLYRSATASVHRDIYLLNSSDRGRSFQGTLLQKWEINACPMSSMDLAANAGVVAAAWETGGQVFWTHVSEPEGRAGQIIPAPGHGKNRKHPRLAVNNRGEVLLVWTEGTGWQKGGSFAWQVFDRSGRPVSELGQAPGIPAWSFAAAAVRPDDGFTIVY